jgi:adenylate cyclase
MGKEKKNGKIWIRSIIIAVICSVLTIVLYKAGLLTTLENKTYDTRMLSTSKFIHPDDNIALIVIDQDSLDWASQERGWSWPWPRESAAEIVDYLSLGNPKSICFDMLYTEPSFYGLEDDEKYGESEKKSGKVVQTIHVIEHGNSSLAKFPVSPIKDNAAVIASVTSKKDDDDIIRRARLYFEYNGKKYPSLGIAPLVLEDIDYEDTPYEEEPGIVRLRYQTSTDAYNPWNAKTIMKSSEEWKKLQAGEITQEEFDENPEILGPEFFEDLYIFVALYAPGLFDICSTPVSQVYPGVGVHMTTLDNFLNDSFVRKLSDWMVFIWIVLLSFFGSMIVSFAEGKGVSIKKTTVRIIIGFALGLVLSIGVPYGLFIPGIWLPIIIPLLGFILSFLSALGLNYALEGRQKRFIQSAFSQYLSPAVIDQLIADPDKLKLGGERREISIYFSDIQGFTSISENFPPEKLIGILNKYLSEMTNIILASGGTIDKYEGDAIIAFWNAPLEEADHGKRAVLAAMKCQKRLDELRDEFEKLSGKKFYQRIGLNTGTAVIGNMGSEIRFDYTMLGDSVNLASRLEGLNKQFGTYTMCTEATRQAAIRDGVDLGWRKLANVAVVGKKEAVVVYEPMEKELYLKKRDLIEKFEAACNLFYAGKFSLALTIFERYAEVDAPCKKYMEKCRSFIENPPKEWNGVWEATSK